MQLYPNHEAASVVEAPPKGVYEGIELEEYMKWDALNNSRLSWMMRTPAYCAMRQVTKEKLSTEQSATRMFGSAMDCSILKPDEFGKRYCVHPEGNRNSNAYKGMRDELREEGWKLLNQDKFDACLWVRDALYETPSEARDLLMAATRTNVCYRGDFNGYPTKSEIDFQIPDQGMNGEIKTSADITNEGFSRILSNLGYYRQRVWSQWTAESVEPEQWPNHRIIAIQSSDPWETRVFEIQPATVMIGVEECQRLAAQYIECRRTGVWDGYPNEVTPIDVPAWRFSRS